MTLFAGRARWCAETQLTLRLVLFAFLIAGVPRVYTQTAAHGLFIDAHGAAALPWAYLAQALCVPAAGALYIAATRRFRLRTLLVAALASQVVMLLLLRAGLALGWPLMALACIVYFEIEFVLSSLLLWGLAGQLMTLRQGKRRFGVISAGEPVAVIVCGLAAPALLRWLAPADLLLLSAAAAALGIVLVLSILRRHLPIGESADTAKSVAAASFDTALVDRRPAITATTAHGWHGRYLVCMVVLVAVGQLGYFLVDNAFYLEASRRHADAESLTSFLALISAAVGAVSLICGALVAPWLLRRFGVRGGLLTLPLLLLAGSLATVSASAFGGAMELLFVLVVGNKVIDQSLRYTVDKTTFVTLLQPLPARQRLRVQAGLESIVEPLSGGLAAALLFAMLHAFGFGVVAITGVILAVACVWAALVAVQYRGYLGALRAALSGPSTRLRAGRGGAAPVVVAPLSNPRVLREALLAEIDRAAPALAAWGRLQDVDGPEVEARRRALAEVVDLHVKQCFTHLAGLAHGIDMASAYTRYAQGGPEQRSYVMELLDNVLDRSLKRRLFPLLEPQRQARVAQRTRRGTAVAV